jgi:hypothetical protein
MRSRQSKSQKAQPGQRQRPSATAIVARSFSPARAKCSPGSTNLAPQGSHPRPRATSTSPQHCTSCHLSCTCLPRVELRRNVAPIDTIAGLRCQRTRGRSHPRATRAISACSAALGTWPDAAVRRRVLSWWDGIRALDGVIGAGSRAREPAFWNNPAAWSRPACSSARRHCRPIDAIARSPLFASGRWPALDAVIHRLDGPSRRPPAALGRLPKRDATTTSSVSPSRR